MSKFLENIRQTIKKAVETMKKREIRKEDKNRSFLKLKARKHIIQKLATPFVLRPQHRIIEYNNIPDTQNRQQIKNTDDQVQKSETTPTDINTFLRKNPALMPFKFPDIRQFLSKLSQPKEATFKDSNTYSSTSTLSATTDYPFLDALHDWYTQFLKGMLDFWLFFKKFFIDNSKAFNYLKHNICAGEIIEGIGGNEIISDKLHEVVEKLKKNNIGDINLNLLIEPESGNSVTYRLSSYVKKECTIITPSFNLSKSLCYNVSSLSLLGRLMYMCNKYWIYFSNMNECLEKSFKEKDISKCKDIKTAINRLNKFAKKWFKLANTIFSQQIIPTIEDMCYKKCMCLEIGIKCMEKDTQSPQPIDNLTLLYYNLLKDRMENLAGDYAGMYQKLSKIKEIIFNPVCSDISMALQNRIKRFLQDTEQTGIITILKDFKWLEANEQGCAIDLCKYEAGVCKQAKICESYYDSTECENNGCIWQSSYCMTPKCSEFSVEQCVTQKRCGLIDNKCIPTEKYCDLLPPPGKGSLNSKLLSEIALKLDKLETEKYQFKNDLINILRNSKNDIFCNVSAIKSILNDQALQRILEIPTQNIFSERDNFKEYQILLNLPSIANGSIQNTPLLKGRTYNDITNFISAWTSKLNYLDYQLYSYFISYKVDKCSGKVTNNFNEWLDKETGAGMDPTKRFYECIYKDEEFRKCLDNSYKTDSGEVDSNYKALQELIDKFFNSISTKIELSNIDRIVIQFTAIRNKKQYEIWPEIKGACEAVKNGMLIPMERCPDINQLDLEYIKQLTSPPLSLQPCPHSQQCKLCYTVNTNAGTVYIPTFDTCGNCDNEEECKGNTSNSEKCPKNSQCSSTASIITGLIITYTSTTYTDEDLQNAINEFKNNWDYLIKMLQNKVCKYEGIGENFCKDIENKTMELIVPTPDRNLHKKSLEKLLGKDTYNLLEEKIKNFIENPHTTDINCNDL